MAKKPGRIKKGVGSFLDMISGVYPVARLDELKPLSKPVNPQKRLISDDERTSLVERAMSAQGGDRNAQKAVSFTDYIRRTSTIAARNRVENAQILQMCPEISQAESIIWPAIVAPNDLKIEKTVVTVNCHKISADQKNKITRLLTDFFERHINLSNSIVEWGKTAMFRTGATPILIVPIKALEKKFTDPSAFVGTTEQFSSTINQLSGHSLFGMADTPDDNSIDRVVASTESLSDSMMMSRHHAEEGGKSSTYDRDYSDKKAKAYRALVSDIISTESLQVVDNPDILGAAVLRKKRRSKNMKNTVNAYYTEKPTDSLTINEDDNVVDHPLLLTLTKEAVIPIFPPGEPNNPLGYLVTIDKHGHPSNVTEFEDKGLSSRFIDGSNTNNFNQLYQAYGYGNNPNITDGVAMTVKDHDVMADVYRNIVEAHVKDRLETGGLNDVTIGTNESVFKFLFSQYLQKRSTRLLFVPPELLTYFCFRRDSNGMGISKLEDLKHILSLRTTLTTVRSLSAVDSSINRKKLTINIPQDFEGDVLEHIFTVMNATIKKSTFQFGYDPIAIAAQVAEKTYDMEVQGIPEFNYSITGEHIQKPKTEIDEQLFDLLTKLFILGLDVPPAALNSLSEDEYSRSVATMNLFFSRKLVAWQQVVIEAIGKVVQDFVKFSAPLRQDIEEILKVDGAGDSNALSADKTRVNDGHVTDDDMTNIDRRPLMREVLDAITIELPSPTIAPEQAQLDALDKLLENIHKLTEVGLPDAIAGDNQDIQRLLQNARAHAATQLLQEFLHTHGFTNIKLPTVTTMDINAMLSDRTRLFNGATAFNQADALFSAPMGNDTLNNSPEQDNGDDSGGGDDFLNDTGGGDDGTGDLGDPGDAAGGDGDGGDEGAVNPDAAPTAPDGNEGEEAPTGKSLI